MGDAVAGAGGPARAGGVDENAIYEAIKIYQFYYYPLDLLKDLYINQYGESQGVSSFESDRKKYSSGEAAESKCMNYNYNTNYTKRYIEYGWTYPVDSKRNRIPALKKGLTELYKKYTEARGNLIKVELESFRELFTILKFIPGGKDSASSATDDLIFKSTIDSISETFRTNKGMFDPLRAVKDENKTTLASTVGKREVSFLESISDYFSSDLNTLKRACLRSRGPTVTATVTGRNATATGRNATATVRKATATGRNNGTWWMGGRPSRKKAHRVKRRKTRSRKAKSQ